MEVQLYDSNDQFNDEYLKWFLRYTDEGQLYLHNSELFRELERKFNTPAKHGKRHKK